MSFTAIHCRHLFVCLALGMLASGCGKPRPTVEFTKVPPAREGDPVKLDPIEGRVLGGTPGQRIVLYAKSGTWWVQPMADNPYTAVQGDATWRNVTHPGTEYAALLVDSGYVPPSQLKQLPTQGGAVQAVAVVKGAGTLPPLPKIVHFSGYDWIVREQWSERGGKLSPYSPANVWLDRSGHLHLRTTRQGSDWAGAEVQLTHSLGHGLYLFTVEDVSTLDPATALTLYSRDESALEQNYRELDIEISRWGEPGGQNGQFVMPPYSEPSNVVRFEAPPGPLSFSFRWSPGSVDFKAFRKSGPIAEHEFTAGVPTPGDESAHMTLYVYGHSPIPAQRGSEVVIEKFEYLP